MSQVTWGDPGALEGLGTGRADKPDVALARALEISKGAWPQGPLSAPAPALWLYSYFKEALDFESLNKSGQGTQYPVLPPFPLPVDHRPEPERPDPRLNSLPHPSDH